MQTASMVADGSWIAELCVSSDHMVDRYSTI